MVGEVKRRGGDSPTRIWRLRIPNYMSLFSTCNSLTSHHVHRPWNQNSRRRWCGSDGYVLFLCQPLNLPTRSPGLGIAYVAALRAKVPVQLYDRSSEQISKGLNLMDRLLAKDVSKGKIQEADARHARERVSVIDQALGLRGLRDADMVIEVRNQIDSFLPVR